MFSRRIHLRALAELYVRDNPHLSPGYRRRIRYVLNRWERATGDPPVKKICETHGYELRRSFDGHSPRTVNAYWIVVRTLLRYAQRRGMLDKIPSIPPIKTCALAPKPTPTVEEIGRMYAVAPEVDLTWPRDECPFRFWRRWLTANYLTGLRLGDMLRLSPGDIQGEWLKIKAGKTSRAQLFPLCPLLRSALNVPSERVFVCSKSPHLIRRELAKLSAAVGASIKVTPQSIRRLSITQWSLADETAGKIIHGSGLGVLRHYIQVEQVLREARKRLAVPKSFSKPESKQLRLF